MAEEGEEEEQEHAAAVDRSQKYWQPPRVVDDSKTWMCIQDPRDLDSLDIEKKRQHRRLRLRSMQQRVRQIDWMH